MDEKGDPGSEKPVTIKEIANLSGVHYGTVSRVLNGKYGHRQQVCDRVLRVAKDLGYRPNRAAAHLAARRMGSTAQRQLIPIVRLSRSVPPEVLSDAAIRCNFKAKKFDQSRDAIQTLADDMGYAFEEFDLSKARSDRAACLELYNRGVRGIILGHFADGRLPLDFDWNLFSVVSLSPGKFNAQFNQVGTDPFAAATTLWQELWARGYRRIGAALWTDDSNESEHFTRLAAIEACQRASGQPVAQRIPTYIDSFANARSRKVGNWIEKWKPDVIIGFNVGLYYTLKNELGLRIPEDLSFAALKGSAECPILHQCACMDERPADSIRIAIEVLDESIRIRRTGMPQIPRSIVTRAVFIDGPSLDR